MGEISKAMDRSRREQGKNGDERLTPSAPARVITAVPLEKDLSERLQKELERLTGKNVRIRPLVDPRIIGGAIVMIGGQIYDRSIRHELARLREDLLGVSLGH